MTAPNQHSNLAASAGSKWVYCPPTLWMEEGIPNFTSKYAQEGTDAHRLAELKIDVAVKKITRAAFNRELKKLKKASQFYDKDMETYTDQHRDLILEEFTGMQDAEIFTEQKVDYGNWAPGGWGTADAILVNDDLLSIWDLKYGKGVKVRADHNIQLMLYALGAYSKLGLLFNFNSVRMTINQPRIGNLQTFEISLDELLDWGDKVVRPAADKALNGEGDWNFSNPETWRFYRAAGFDRHLAEQNLKIRKYKFKEANTLTKKEIADILEQAPVIKQWLTAVETYATTLILDKGEKIPGFRVGESRTRRVITDTDAAAKILEENGYKDIYTTPVLKNLTALEKQLGKQTFIKLLSNLITKSEGRPVIVKEDDSRPNFNKLEKAQNDFNDFNDTTTEKKENQNNDTK